MAETTLKNIVDFRKSDSPKGKVAEKKSDSHQFRDLVKEKKADSCGKADSLNKSQKTTPNTDKETKVRVSLDKIDKDTTSSPIEVEQEETSAEISFLETSTPVLVVATQLPLPPETVAEMQVVEDEFVEEDTENRDLEEVVMDSDEQQDAPDIEFSTQEVQEIIETAEPENVIATSAVPLIADTQPVIDAEESSDKHPLAAVIEEPLEASDLSRESNLSQEEQALHQKPISSDSLGLKKSDTPVIEAESLPNVQNTKPQSDLIKKVAIDPEIEIVVAKEKDEFLQFAKNSDPKPVLTSMNLNLADTTRHGNKVISAMQKISDQTQQGENSSILGAEEIDSIADVMNFDLGENGGDRNTHKNSSFLNVAGVVLENISEETFTVSFSEKNLNSSRNELEKPSMQVSLAVSKVLSSTGESDKKQITINLHPQTLGAVKVEILSATGRDGVSKIENIKIIAEKASTHILLEEGKKDLEKSLKEVMSVKEESSLQFEMNEDSQKRQNAYFASLEEKNSWMNQFQGLVSEGVLSAENIVDEYATRGTITDEEVNLVV